MENSSKNVYDLKGFLAIGNRTGEPAIDRYRQLALEFFKRLKKLPTKYDLYSQPQYVVPQEILPHSEEYSKETVFPRSRVLPEEAPKTRWEMFAERKGIKKNKNKRGGRIYDKITREYTPSYGRGSKSDLDRQWIIEVKENEDPMVDRHELLKQNKKRGVALQENKEYKNLKRAKKLSHFQKGGRDLDKI